MWSYKNTVKLDVKFHIDIVVNRVLIWSEIKESNLTNDCNKMYKFDIMRNEKLLTCIFQFPQIRRIQPIRRAKLLSRTPKKAGF